MNSPDSAPFAAAPGYPLVSIVTPTYNQGQFLAATLDSLLAQDYPAIEYLVLDDGSTDQTPAVLERYRGRVEWERQANMGQSRTLNKGWGRASGEYIGYLSSDDLLLPHAVSALVAALQANPAAAVAYCDFDIIDSKGKQIRVEQSQDFDHRRMLELLVCPPGPGALFRRSVFDQIGGWNEQLRKIPDFEFWLRAARLGPFIRIPQVLAQYRVHEESGSIRPISVERSMEIVVTMRAYWSGQEQGSARLSMASAHLRAAHSLAQSGHVWRAFAQFGAAARYRPKTFFSISAWRGLLAAYAMRIVGRFGNLSARLR